MVLRDPLQNLLHTDHLDSYSASNDNNTTQLQLHKTIHTIILNEKSFSNIKY